MAATHILSPLRRPTVARLWSALAFSALGDQLYAVALGFVAVDLLGPAAGYLSAARPAVILLAACLGGGLADRLRLRWSMIGADLARAGVLLILVVAWVQGGHRPSVLLLALAVVVLAIGESVFEPALQAFIPALVFERRLLVATNGLFDATDRLARLLGPGLIALAGSLVPIVHFFSLDALSFLVSGVAIASVRGVDEPRAARPRSSVHDNPTGGLGAIRRQPLLSYALDIKSLTNGVWYVVFFLVVPLAILSEHIAKPGGAALAAYGLVIASYGVSNLAANLVVGSLALPPRPARRVLAGVLITGSGIVLMAAMCAAPLPQGLRLWALAAASCVSGFGGPLQDITLATLRQTLIPAGEIAAATRVMLIATFAGTLIAMLAAPMLVETLGPVSIMAIGGAIYIACAAYGWLRSAVWASRL
jgi:MFS transporter, DHA3 family, macrolide efflux protein